MPIRVTPTSSPRRIAERACSTGPRRGRDARPRSNAARASIRRRVGNTLAFARTCPTLADERSGARRSFIGLGEFEIIRELGRGGCAVVYQATHPRFGIVALKVASPSRERETTANRRLFREAEFVSRISHPNVVRVHETGRTEDGHAFVVMDYLDGIDLQSVLSTSAPLPVAIACEIVCELLEGLEAVHAAGVIHRDIKPSNVMLCRTHDSESTVVKLIDFGVALDGDDDRLTQPGLMVGTPRCFAPEQVSGRAIDGRTDLWSVGVLFYELLTGASPVERSNIGATIAAILFDTLEPVTSVRADVPTPISSVIARAMARDPDARFPDTAAMRAALEDAMREAGVLGSRSARTKRAA